MRYLKHFNESISSYNFKFDGETYEFTDGENIFEVEFTLEDDIYELKWYLNKDGVYTYDIINGNIYRIMETIFGKILNDFIQKNENCDSILIKGMAKNKERQGITQRTNVYFRYLRTHPISGWTLDKYQNEIYLDKNE